jgi:diguanylate cyclase (GGDEF)-like protein
MSLRSRIVAICLLLAIGVGALDALSPLGVAAAALYAVVIVASLPAQHTGVTIQAAALCAALIVAGGVFSPASAVPIWIVVVNRFLFILLVGVTATLVINRQRAERLIRAQQAQLERANCELAWQARNDALTGIANRRAFDEHLALECGHANRTRAPLSLLMIDVDHFKHYNDVAGHPAGDACLREVASAIRASLRRPIDFAARYGGEEFAVILPATGVAGARERAEGICGAVRQLGIDHPGQASGAVVTVSVGVASRVAPISTEKLVGLADAALYMAKGSGRDRAVCAE